MGVFGFLGSMFGKSDDVDKLSTAEIQERIALKEARLTTLRELLARAGADEAARAKSDVWFARLEAQIEGARSRSDMSQLSKLEAEMKQAQTKAKKILDGAQAMHAEVQTLEDEIELLTRALEKH